MHLKPMDASKIFFRKAKPQFSCRHGDKSLIPAKGRQPSRIAGIADLARAEFNVFITSRS
jgi:hypothetical protein